MTALPVPIRDAASILVLDRHAAGGPSVLMGQRGRRAAFMPSKYVFPGGAMDAQDCNIALARPLPPVSARRLAADFRDGSIATPQALAAAALRELAEETGLICGAPADAESLPGDWPGYAGAGLCPDPSGLFYIFRAITPPHLNHRFDTRFFLLDKDRIHGDPHDFSRACDELADIHWVPLSGAGRLDLPFITEIVLAEVAAMLAAAGNGPPGEADSVPFFDNRDHEPRFTRIA